MTRSYGSLGAEEPQVGRKVHSSHGDGEASTPAVNPFDRSVVHGRAMSQGKRLRRCGLRILADPCPRYPIQTCRTSSRAIPAKVFAEVPARPPINRVQATKFEDEGSGSRDRLLPPSPWVHVSWLVSEGIETTTTGNRHESGTAIGIMHVGIVQVGIAWR